MTQTNDVIKEGWMTKQGGFWRTWHKRWFTLIGNVLEYYVQPGVELKGSINIMECISVERAPECKKQPAFKIIKGETRTYYIVAENEKEVNEWVTAIHNVLHPPERVPMPVCIDDFKVIRLAGHGIHSVITLSKYVNENQLVILKQYQKKHVGDRSSDIEIINKTQKMKDILFLCSISEVVETSTSYVIISNYVIGDVCTRIRLKGPVPEKQVKIYIAEILLGLEHLHKNHLFFGDFHSSNVLLDEKGHVCLTPIGFRFPLNPKQDRYLEYMSPNYLSGQPATESDDLWGLGIMIYEMLSGYLPFSGHGAKELVKIVADKKIIFPQWVTEPAQHFILKLLGRDPVKITTVEQAKSDSYLEGLNWYLISEQNEIPDYVPQPSEIDQMWMKESFINENHLLYIKDDSHLIEAQ